MPDLSIFTWRLINLPAILLQGIFWACFLYGCLKLKNCIKMQWVPYVVCSILIFCAISTCNHLSNYEGPAIFLCFLILFLCSLLFCQGLAAKKLFMSMVPADAMAMGNVFTVSLASYILNKPLEDFTSDRWLLRLISAAISAIFLLVIFCIIKKITDKGSLNLNKFEWLMLGINPALFTIAYTFISWTDYSSQSATASFFSWLSVTAVILINITMYFQLSIYNCRHKAEMENTLLRQQLVYQSETICETKRQYDALQKTKHDFNNMIGVIQYLNKDNKNREIDAYIREHFDMQDISVKMIHTGNSCIDAIINAKVSQAAKSDIKVLISSTALKLNTEYNMDLCNLIGNLFENAMRASAESIKKTIYLDIRNDSGGLSICMKNTIDDSVLEKNPKLATNKTDPANHGYGIQIIKEIVKQHGGLIDFYEEDGCFCCNIIHLIHI